MTPGAGRAVLWLAAAGLLAAAPAPAYFDDPEVGVRSVGFARAFTAIADDATALYWNPGALAGLRRPEIDLVYSRPYLLSNLNSSYGAVAMPLKGAGTGALSWQHEGVTDALDENTFTAGFGREIVAAPSGLSVAVGGAIKLATVSIPVFIDGATGERVDYGSATGLAGDLGVIVRFPNRMSVGAVIQNLGSPEFDLVSGSAGGTSLPTLSRVGASYRWNPESIVSVDYQQVDGGSDLVNVGGEVWFYQAFAVRAGISDMNAGGGVTVKARRWLLDLAFLTNRALGVSYRAGLRIPFGR